MVLRRLQKGLCVKKGMIVVAFASCLTITLVLEVKYKHWLNSLSRKLPMLQHAINDSIERGQHRISVVGKELEAYVEDKLKDRFGKGFPQ